MGYVLVSVATARAAMMSCPHMEPMCGAESDCTRHENAPPTQQCGGDSTSYVTDNSLPPEMSD